MAPFLDRPDALKQQLDIYREAAIKAGKTPRLALLRDGWLASSVEAAEQTFGRLWIEECKFYFRWGMLAPTPDFRAESDFTVEKVRRHMVLGTTADWLEQLDHWQREFGVEWFILRCRLPLGPGPEQTRECIQRLGEEVLPKLKHRT
jgi:alkanesulfonate monooxygenase SsuD/methylene tetrahydromethanopterin reductase-like flavin-dependent oxidoreductase (luciferase family)